VPSPAVRLLIFGVCQLELRNSVAQLSCYTTPGVGLILSALGVGLLMPEGQKHTPSVLQSKISPPRCTYINQQTLLLAHASPEAPEEIACL